MASTDAAPCCHDPGGTGRGERTAPLCVPSPACHGKRKEAYGKCSFNKRLLVGINNAGEVTAKWQRGVRRRAPSAAL